MTVCVSLTIVEIEIFDFNLTRLRVLVLKEHALREILTQHHLAASLSEESVDLLHVVLVGVVVNLLLLLL